MIILSLSHFPGTLQHFCQGHLSSLPSVYTLSSPLSPSEQPRVTCKPPSYYSLPPTPALPHPMVSLKQKRQNAGMKPRVKGQSQEWDPHQPFTPIFCILLEQYLSVLLCVTGGQSPGPWGQQWGDWLLNHLRICLYVELESVRKLIYIYIHVHI